MCFDRVPFVSSPFFFLSPLEPSSLLLLRHVWRSFLLFILIHIPQISSVFS
jgi:hypothetical protein